MFLVCGILLYKGLSGPDRKSPFQELYISREEFNKKFNAEMVGLPTSLIAFGFEPSSVSIYKSSKCTDRQIRCMKNTLSFWIENIHPKLTKKTYVVVLSINDGYPERTPFYQGVYTYKKYPDHEFEDKFEIKLHDPTILPILHKEKIVLAYAKRFNDTHTIAIPDLFFTETKGYQTTLLRDIDSSRVDWEKKKSLCVWRGTGINGASCNLIGKHCSEPINQRQLFIQQYKQGSFVSMDYNETFLSKQDQLHYKYILDIDGWTNTWDGTVWKLYSGSVLLKCKSVWKQWYYDDLKEYIHYVPVANDFSDLNQKIEWCKLHDKECQEITRNAIDFVKTKLNWNKVIEDCVRTVQMYI